MANDLELSLNNIRQTLNPLSTAQKNRKSPASSSRQTVDCDWAAYMKRLDSFDLQKCPYGTWPAQLNPVLFASRGWAACRSDVVQCSYCHNFISVKMPSVTDGDNSNARMSTTKFVMQKVRNGHCKHCPWVSVATPRHPSTRFDIVSAFHLLKTYLSTGIVVPVTDVLFDLSRFSSYLEDNRSAAILAFFGWIPVPKDYASKQFLDYLRCRLCGTRIAVRPYVLDGSFRPVDYHAPFCPVRQNTSEFYDDVLLANDDSLQQNVNVMDDLKKFYDFIDHISNAFNPDGTS